MIRFAAKSLAALTLPELIDALAAEQGLVEEPEPDEGNDSPATVEKSTSTPEPTPPVVLPQPENPLPQPLGDTPLTTYAILSGQLAQEQKTMSAIETLEEKARALHEKHDDWPMSKCRSRILNADPKLGDRVEAERLEAIREGRGAEHLKKCASVMNGETPEHRRLEHAFAAAEAAQEDLRERIDGAGGSAWSQIDKLAQGLVQKATGDGRPMLLSKARAFVMEQYPELAQRADRERAG